MIYAAKEAISKSSPVAETKRQETKTVLDSDDESLAQYIGELSSSSKPSSRKHAKTSKTKVDRLIAASRYFISVVDPYIITVLQLYTAGSKLMILMALSLFLSLVKY